MQVCNNCDMMEYCNEIRRCFRAGIETDTFEGMVVSDKDDLTEDEVLKREKKVKPVKHLNDQHREFLRDALNF